MTTRNDQSATTAVAQERTRILALIDVDQESRFSPAMREAITNGTSAGDFAIALVTGTTDAAGARGRDAVATAIRHGHPGLAHLRGSAD